MFWIEQLSCYCSEGWVIVSHCTHLWLWWNLTQNHPLSLILIYYSLALPHEHPTSVRHTHLMTPHVRTISYEYFSRSWWVYLHTQLPWPLLLQFLWVNQLCNIYYVSFGVFVLTNSCIGRLPTCSTWLLWIMYCHDAIVKSNILGGLGEWSHTMTHWCIWKMPACLTQLTLLLFNFSPIMV